MTGVAGKPFQVSVPDAAIDELHARIDAARWPDALDGAGWDYGMPVDVLRELVEHWRSGFDWRAAEARINGFAQLIVDVDGYATHCIHQRSPHRDATPLLLMHGWPGSIVEFLAVIPRLTEPEKYGGRAEDAYHVVAPSLPGAGWSQAWSTPGMGPPQVAARMARLMSGLGYDRFIAQGGDWGSVIARYLPGIVPERLIGLHQNMVLASRPRDIADPMALLTPAERTRIEWERTVRHEWTGYQHQQGTKPQTLAYGLADSPIGLAAWIAEKFHAWTQNDGDIRDAVSFDDLLANISIYWFTNTIASSIRFYRELFAGRARGEHPVACVDTPYGAAIYPGEMTRPPKAWVEREYNLVHWFEAERGGHFAALEQPEIFARDLLAFGATARTIDQEKRR